MELKKYLAELEQKKKEVILEYAYNYERRPGFARDGAVGLEKRFYKASAYSQFMKGTGHYSGVIFNEKYSKDALYVYKIYHKEIEANRNMNHTKLLITKIQQDRRTSLARAMNLLSNQLFEICTKYLKTSLSEFLTNGRTSMKQMGKKDMLPELAVGQCDWYLLGKQGTKEFVKAIRDSKVFNMRAKFWINKMPPV